MFYKLYNEIIQNFAKNNGPDAQYNFTICKPYVKQKGSQNSQMPCQDRPLFSIKYKKSRDTPVQMYSRTERCTHGIFGANLGQILKD